MTDPWSAFPDADSDPWADFPDADNPPRQKPIKPGGKIVDPGGPKLSSPDRARLRGFPQNVRMDLPSLDGATATDGDTLRADKSRVRVWGIDAPELGQQGWDRLGNPVPIGAQSRDWLQGAINTAGRMGLGGVKGNSYGRLVGPVSLGDIDAGLASVRSGNALAAPSFVRDDPAYRFKLMESERLARLNGLGPVNDTLAQNPAQFRLDPDWKPDRETVAQFWDTPTPHSGMKPDAEREYIELLHSGTPEQIHSFGTAQGYGMDLAAVEKWAAWRDKELAKGGRLNLFANYQPGPPVMQLEGDGIGGAGGRAFSEGFLAGGLGELGAVVDTLGGTKGRENVWNSDRRLADIWANNEFQNASILRGDEYAHPTATTVGNIGGAITSGFAIPYGAGARTVPALAKVGGVYGGLEGFLGTDGGIPERLTGAAIGAPLGAIINAAGGKGLEYALPALGRGVNAIAARLPRKATSGAAAASETAGEAGLDYTGDNLGGAMQDAAARGGDPWADFPDAPFSANDNAGRAVDRIDIGPLPPRPPEPRGPSINTAYPGPTPGMRDRDWIDVSQVPPLPRAIGMDVDPMPSVSALPRQRDYLDLSMPGKARPLLDPATAAERALAAKRISTNDVLPMPSNRLDGVDEAISAGAGRFAPAKAPNERSGLSKGTVRGWNGSEVPKVGPTDLVGWLRLRGGLRDSGGELKHMGLTNAPRRGLEHVGQEHRFGPLVNEESGTDLDDAALAAWEAGYFPEHSERPSINEFLDALRETYNGNTGRRFHPDDFDELERFEAMRGERFDLEQQEREAGTVWNDLSSPADESSPFPPVEAYEEWPSDAIKRVGNVDVTKLETPQDISRALRASHYSMGGFDAATRGRITHAETERLATELGMTADDLLARRKGQAFNAEEALAARQILAKSGNELVNLARRIQRVERPGDVEGAAFQRALMRHAAIQEQVAGGTAEAGRALQQFRMMADSRRVPGEVLAGIVDANGGPKRIKDAANTILEAIEGPPGRFNTAVRKAANPRFADKLAELYINFLLSGPQTHVVNAVSNTMTSISQIPENAVASAFGGVRKLAARKEVDRVLAGELGARLFGMVQGTKEGARLFARALRTGETSDTFSKIAGHDMRAISGLKGEVIRIPGRLLNSADEFFKGISRRAEINALAYRQAHREGLAPEAVKARVADLSANPTEAIELRGLDFARYMTFQRPLDGFGQKVSQLTREYPLLRPIITFVRTPANLLKFAVERSPAAPLLKSWRADFKAGGARRDLAMARATLGTGFAALFYQAALDGRVTGSAPSDKAKERWMRADGWQPYSVRIGDQWVSYSRLDPFAMQLGVAADLALKADGMSDKQLDNYAMLMVASIMSQLADKTWLSGVTDFSEALDDPERYGPAYLRRLGAALAIPNLSAQTARAIDPVARDRKTMGEELQARIPGLSDNLLPKRDIWGQPIASEGGAGPDILNPFRQSTIRRDPVNAAMLAIGARFGPPSKQRTVDGKKVEWTPEEYDRLQEMAGRDAYSGIAALISDPAFAEMPNGARLKAAERVFKKARENARNTVGSGGGGNGGSGAPASDPWGDFPDAQPSRLMGDEWGAFPDAPSRDVVGDLTKAIPGIRFTSGLRDPAYNASLKARGYHPADNSEHLDGSALDMLPPPGKSLPWLRSAVRQYDPKARLLVHDGHLHGGFNGYYKAPKLGGMARR